MAQEGLPSIVQQVSDKYPAVWETYTKLGEAAAEAGPLEPKVQRLVKLALAIAAGRQGAVHSHTRRGLAAGISPEELEHVALLAITTIGWSSAMAGLSWIRDLTQKQS